MKILIPVDGSAPSQAAVDFVAARVRPVAGQTDLRLLNVQRPIPARAARAAGREMVRHYHRADAQAVLAPAQERLAAAGLSAKSRYAVGDPGEVVVRAAVQGHADLVVMGSRGRTALQGLVFGSVTQAVLNGSTAPLLVLREKPPEPQRPLRVVIAIDGSLHGLAAVRCVLAQRALLGTAPQFQLVHLLDEHEDGSGSARFDAVVGPAIDLFAEARVGVEAVRLVGRQADEAIVEHLQGVGADLVAMGSHGRGLFKQLLLGSVATGVAARCRLPLLIVRPRPGRPAGHSLQRERAAAHGHAVPSPACLA